MAWRVRVRPEAQSDIFEAARWYESKSTGLGKMFVEEVLTVLDALTSNPLLSSRRHPTKDIRWRYPERFPYKVIYEVLERDKTVVVAAVLHAARHDRSWRDRI